MPDISSYKINTAPDPSDILIGTDVTNGQTKNFSIQSLSITAVNNFLKHTSWQFVTLDPDPDPRPEGSISFENYGGQSTPWSSITNLYINTTMPSTSPTALAYLQRLVGLTIIIQDTRSLSRFGIYRLTSLTQVDGSVYNMSLTYVDGSATIQALQYYTITIDEAEGGDAYFEYVQGIPSAQWDIVHNLNKYPSVTVVDTANTTVIGSYEYTSSNTLTLNFSAPFAGKAFLN